VDSGPCSPARAATHDNALVWTQRVSHLLLASTSHTLTCTGLDSFFSEMRDIRKRGKRCQQGTIGWTSSNCTFLTTLASAANISHLRKETVEPLRKSVHARWKLATRERLAESTRVRCCALLPLLDHICHCPRWTTCHWVTLPLYVHSYTLVTLLLVKGGVVTTTLSRRG
jgi:hypothetical protein